MKFNGIFGSDPQTQILVNNCVGAASFALLYYDYLLTLPTEVSRFWNSRRLTWASSLFYGNRYISLIGHVPVMFQYFWTSPDLKTCKALSSFHQYLAVLIQIIVGIILIIRTYALYGCNRFILLLLCSCALTVIVYGIWCVMSQQSPNYTVDDLLPNSCLLPVFESLSSRLASAWTGMLCFDILIFCMTLYKSLTSRNDGNSNILHVMLRDGTIYFGVMMCFCVTILLSFHFSPLYSKGVTTILTNVISSTMASRLMLNIRDPRLTSSYQVTYTYPIFTSILDTNANYELHDRSNEEHTRNGDMHMNDMTNPTSSSFTEGIRTLTRTSLQV
ncbi:hypothetical protein BDN70DRAFT_871667 [Pholiota conissans]|uniref:DUF6533 domain-containing protein n=1 Tax=Pholiota conissans TaxID=109636 RepID=A0A9P5ZE11_9AGAR|nr:hypothetical protein BDN70DRAFT_871667 [Pholiota conissans]